MRSTNLLSREAVSYIETPISLRPNADTYLSPCYVCKISNTQRSVLSIVSLVDYSNSQYKIIPHESVNGKKIDNYRDQFFSEFQLVNPILLFYKKNPKFHLFLSTLISNKNPDVTRFIKGTTYEVWLIRDLQKLYEIQKYFQQIQSFYVADGHHRIEALASLKGYGLYPYSQQYLSLILEEKDLELTSFNRFIRNVTLNQPDVLKKLSSLYKIKKVASYSVMLEKNIYFYTGDSWYKLEVAKLLCENERLFPAIFLDKFLMSELRLEEGSSFDKFIYLPQTNKVNDIISCYRLYDCQLAVSIPKNSLLDLYKTTEKGVRLPPHSTCFTPKIPNNLFIQHLKP